MYKKSLTLEEIRRQKEESKKFIDNLCLLEKKTEEMLKVHPTSLEEAIAQKYIELQHLNDVVNYLNSNGYRIDTGSKHGGKRKYITNDVAGILESMKKDSNIFALAYAYFQYNKDLTDIKTIIMIIKNL